MTVDLLVMTLNEVEGIKKVMPRVKKEWVDRIIIVDGGITLLAPLSSTDS